METENGFSFILVFLPLYSVYHKQCTHLLSALQFNRRRVMDSDDDDEDD